MSLNDEFIENKEEVKTERKKKKFKKIYAVVLSIVLIVLFIVGGLNIYQALYMETGYFYDYSMAPTINNIIKDKDGNVLDYDNYNVANGNLVEYGLIKKNFKQSELKRFDVVVLQDNFTTSYKFSPFRIIGLPGETIKIDYYGKLYVNGSYIKQPIPDKYLEIDWSHNSGEIEDLYYEATLSDNAYYLMKDNRYYYTNDSRTHGEYDIVNIYGIVKVILGHGTISGSNCINMTWPWPRFI